MSENEHQDDSKGAVNLRFVPPPAIRKTCSNCAHRKCNFYYKGKERYVRNTYCNLLVTDNLSHDKKPLEQNMVCDNWLVSGYYEKEVLSLNAKIKEWENWKPHPLQPGDDLL